jgi:transcription elongation factor GreB
MSKAFTRETDDTDAGEVLPRPSQSLPPGVNNYLTSRGAEHLRRELGLLLEELQAKSDVSSGERASRSRQLLEQRIAHLERSLASAVIVAPAARTDRVRFGATVTVRDRHGSETEYRIVGVDEVDLERNGVSWLSPLAKALLGKCRDERVTVSVPAGAEELVVSGIRYE